MLKKKIIVLVIVLVALVIWLVNKYAPYCTIGDAIYPGAVKSCKCIGIEQDLTEPLSLSIESRCFGYLKKYYYQ